MTLSPRLTRAAFAFLLFGTAAALLPAQDNAALAGNGCFTGPPGTTGEFAIGGPGVDVRDSYLLTPTTTYKYYYKADAASAYGAISSNVSTTFQVNSGQAQINGQTYLMGSQPPRPSTGSFFTIAQVVTSRNFSGMPTGYAAGSVTATSIYTFVDTKGNKTTYIATADFSAP